MAEYRPKVPRGIKRKLILEAGRKCANPGCPSRLIEIHHIKEWHVYKTHDEAHMIAVCPSCHDAVTRGKLRIDDETAYRWKKLRRAAANSTHIYLEPGEDLPKIILGTLSVQSETDFVVFELNKHNDLEFSIRGETILLPRLRIGTESELLIDVIDGHVINKSSDIAFDYRPGKVRIDEVHLEDRIPDWAHKIISSDPSIDIAQLPLLDIEAISPGVLRVKGVWVSDDFVVIINDRQLSFIYPGLLRPLTIVGTGDGTQSVLRVSGPSVLFALGPKVKS
jgi:hypothetical protein